LKSIEFGENVQISIEKVQKF